MKHGCHVVALLVVLGAPGATALVLRQSPEATAASTVTTHEDPDIAYNPMPTVPNATESADKLEAGVLSNAWATSEAHVAEGQAHAAEQREIADSHNLLASQRELESTQAVHLALQAAEHAKRLKVQAQEVAARVDAEVKQIPVVAEKSSARAIHDVLAATLASMSQEACDAAKAAKAVEEQMMRNAATGAQKAALPFQQAKVRAGQSVVSYLTKAQSLGNAAVALKKKAIQIAWQANAFTGKMELIPMAQQMSMQAHDMMDKAQQLAGQASGFQTSASSIENGLGAYDLAADSAAAYGAYEANPGGGPFVVPAMPSPLELPPGCLTLGPAPAPAPASGR